MKDPKHISDKILTVDCCFGSGLTVSKGVLIKVFDSMVTGELPFEFETIREELTLYGVGCPFDKGDELEELIF